MARLADRLIDHRRRREFEKAVQAHLMALGGSRERELIWRYQVAKAREIHRTLATYDKVQREARRRDKEEPIDAGRGAPAGCVQPTDVSLEELDIAVGRVQLADTIPIEPTACAERPPAPPARPEPIAAPPAGDETKPIPTEPALPAAEESIEPDLLAAAAGLDPSDALSAPVPLALQTPERRS